MRWLHEACGPIWTADRASHTPTRRQAGEQQWIFVVLLVFLFLYSLVLGADFIFIGRSQNLCRLTLGDSMLLASRHCVSSTDLK